MIGCFDACIRTEVVIGWEFTIYNVTEGDDQVAELCAVIRSGQLTFELPAILISTEDGTATATASGE